jgi:hypothetical protein
MISLAAESWGIEGGSETAMRDLAVTAVFPWMMAWQYRKNELLCLVVIATLFADAAMLSSQGENVSDRPLRIFSICSLTFMLIAGVFFILSVRKKKRDKSNPGGKAGDALN